MSLPLLRGAGAALAIAALTSLATAQIGWHPLAPSPAPSARAGQAQVYDAARNRIVLFGGWSNLSGTCCTLADTWEWDGQLWLLRQPATVPPPRVSASMAYDSRRQHVVMFGGSSDATTVLGDTWEWDGTDWTLRSPVQSPPARQTGCMVYDLIRGQTVLYGGFDNATFFDDTWTWNGSNWLHHQLVVRPQPRGQAALVYDAATGETLLYGGATPAAQFADTWIWDGAQWVPRSPLTSPGPLWATAWGYDGTRGRVVLFGGYNPNGCVDDMWEWDGVTWDQHGATTAPSNRCAARLDFLPTGEAILFGGMATWGNGAFADTWSFRAQANASYTAFGEGCTGSVGVPVLGVHPDRAQLPWIGTTFGLSVRNLPLTSVPPPLLLFGLSRTAWPPLSLPLPLDPYGLPGCMLLVRPDQLLPGILQATRAALFLPIPATGALLGVRFYNQALVFDPGVNLAGFTVSNAAEGVIGAR